MHLYVHVLVLVVGGLRKPGYNSNTPLFFLEPVQFAFESIERLRLHNITWQTTPPFDNPLTGELSADFQA